MTWYFNSSSYPWVTIITFNKIISGYISRSNCFYNFRVFFFILLHNAEYRFTHKLPYMTDWKVHLHLPAVGLKHHVASIPVSCLILHWELGVMVKSWGLSVLTIHSLTLVLFLWNAEHSMAYLGHCSDNTERNQKHLIVLWLNLTGPLKLILLLQKQFHQNLG